MAYLRFPHNLRDHASSARAEPALICRVVLALLVVMASGAWSRVAADETNAKKAADKPLSPEAIDFFESRVRPILVDRCIKCHGPKKQSSNLRLDSREAALKGGDSGPSLVPAKPEESLLIQAVAQTHEELKMPPDGKLPEASVAIIRQWVALGAPWAAITPKGDPSTRAAGRDPSLPHWSFQPLVSSSLPPVKDRNWAGTPVDAFILARLEAAGLTPSARADKRTLIRRATIDLWGIPPTAEEIDAFELDRAPGAFARVVDRLLASPRYGERWGRHWLDVARYADTKGYVFTQDRHYPYAYTYRDYVIRALNTDLPYDQFVVQQLAADQLPRGGRSKGAGGHGVLDGRPPVPPRSERDHRRSDRRGQSGAPGIDGHMRPLPRPQVRPDPD